MTDTRRAYTPSDFCQAYGIGRTTFYEEVKAGDLCVVKVGRRTLVLMSDVEQWVQRKREQANNKRRAVGE